VVVVIVSRTRDLHLRPALGWVALAGGSFLVPSFLLSRYVGPELPTLDGALIGGLLFVAVLRWTHRRVPVAVAGGGAGSAPPDPGPGGSPVPGVEPGGSPASGADLVRAAAPYLVLVALVLVTRLIAPLRAALTSVTVSWESGAFAGSVQPLHHPGTMLLAAFVLGALIQRAVGTFITGSATASNILFTDLQQATAVNLSMPVPPLLGAQGFGAAAGNMICPHNVVAASATVAISGREGEVLRRTLGVALATPCWAVSWRWCSSTPDARRRTPPRRARQRACAGWHGSRS
jgi:lactate permease